MNLKHEQSILRRQTPDGINDFSLKAINGETTMAVPS
jgi:hypothetical protein